MNNNAVRELERILAQKKMIKGQLADKLGLRPNNFSTKLHSEKPDSIFFTKCAEALDLPGNYFLTFADDNAPYMIPVYLELLAEKDKRIALLEEQIELYRNMRKQE